MSQPASSLNPFARRIQGGTPLFRGVSPSLATTAVTAQPTTTQKQYNPFLTAMNPDSQAFKETYGVNRPLPTEMFLGYRDGKPMFGGSRLFILY